MPWWTLASIVTSVMVTAVEYINRTQPTLGDALWRSWPLILVAQVAIYYAWNRSPAMFLVWAVFAIGNALLRLLVAGPILGEPMRLPWVLGGIALLILGGLAIKVGTTA